MLANIFKTELPSVHKDCLGHITVILNDSVDWPSFDPLVNISWCLFGELGVPSSGSQGVWLIVVFRK